MSMPVYAAMGHPNEGKSSVIATLTENESIPISAIPGETVTCAPYTLEIDGHEALKLLDTPGFQNPGATLAWMEAWEGPEAEVVDGFLKAHTNNPGFHHDCELMGPINETTGLLYVVDASRPLRNVDLQEMEILRLTGRPRLAVLNCKTDTDEYLQEWKEALSRRFNLVREFNAHQSSMAERIALLDSLAQVTPEVDPHLKEVTRILNLEWERRAGESALVLETLWSRTLRHQVRIPHQPDAAEASQFEDACEHYKRDIEEFERKARRDWRGIYLHTSLPAGGPTDDLFTQELFAEKVWRLLGLSRKQIAMGAALTGAGLGAGIDVAAGGITFGVFTAAGAVAGGLASWLGVPKIGKKKLPFPGRRTWGREQIEVGPFSDPQLLFILMDRAILYLHRLMNWAHARHDAEAFLTSLLERDQLSTSWTDEERALALRWINVHKTPGHSKAPETGAALRELIQKKLLKE